MKMNYYWPLIWDFMPSMIDINTSFMTVVGTWVTGSQNVARILWSLGVNVRYSMPKELRSTSLVAHCVEIASFVPVLKALKPQKPGD
jgi:hypothetical protein